MYLGPAIDGTDETLYINIFSLRNFVHLNKVSILYEATYGTSLSTVVTTEFAKDMGNALVSICKLGSVIHQQYSWTVWFSFAVQYSADKALYFSSRFHTTIAGAGTADRDLMRLTVSRCETDLGNIKMAYQYIYEVSLSNAVSVSVKIYIHFVNSFGVVFFLFAKLFFFTIGWYFRFFPYSFISIDRLKSRHQS